MAKKRANIVDTMVGKRICAYRREKGLTQSALAKSVGVTFQQIQKYETGTNRVGAGRLFDMAQVFGIPIQALFPESGKAVEDEEARAGDVQAVSDFVSSAEGWLLCRSFSRIADRKTRKKIIALVRELADDPETDD